MVWPHLATLEAAVDAQFGEPIEILPYRPSDYMGAYEPDPTRTVHQGVGYVVGRQTFLRGAGTGEFNVRRAQADMILSVQDKYFNGTKQHDRVRLIDRNTTMEISYLEIGANKRVIAHLLWVRD